MNMDKEQYAQQEQTICLEVSVLCWGIVKNNCQAVRK